MNEKSPKYEKNAHCSYCGQTFPAGLPWPRRCGHCGNVTYRNPLPVAVVLVPVDDGLLLVRRAIPPRQGALALPGDFINLGETWQEAGVREVREEMGLVLDPVELVIFDVRSAPDGAVLLFALACPRRRADLPPLAPNDEVSEVVIAAAPGEPDEARELAFPLHTQTAARYWEKRARA